MFVFSIGLWWWLHQCGGSQCVWEYLNIWWQKYRNSGRYVVFFVHVVCPATRIFCILLWSAELHNRFSFLHFSSFSSFYWLVINQPMFMPTYLFYKEAHFLTSHIVLMNIMNVISLIILKTHFAQLIMSDETMCSSTTFIFLTTKRR